MVRIEIETTARWQLCVYKVMLPLRLALLDLVWESGIMVGFLWKVMFVGK